MTTADFAAQVLCEQLAPQMDMKVVKIEKATHELVELLVGQEEEEDINSMERSRCTTPTTIRTHSKVSNLNVMEEAELRPGERAQLKQRQRKAELQQEALYLISHFNHCTFDALVRCTRTTLESIRRRVSSPTTLLYGDSAEDKRRDHRPAFQVKLALSIPNVVLRPGLEDVQNALNGTVQCIISVHKRIYQWGQVREEPKPLTSPSKAALAATSAVASTLIQPSKVMVNAPLKNFHRAVVEHKEVAKLVTMLSTTISSAKTIVTHVLEHFSQYKHLWSGEREQQMTEFMESSPGLSEFEAQLREYTRLETVVMEETNLLPAGSLALLTGEWLTPY